ncbi:VPS4-associated protein 1 [Tirmania nivea]|nr:VPS4-associated protein 1 [Tirmania nivea]
MPNIYTRATCIMASPFQNIYNIRTVAGTDSKPCSICYKPTTVYLVTACQKDFFPVCPGHLTDRGFATAIVKTPTPAPSAEELKNKQKEALEKEIELVKKEYEEKQKRKKEKEKSKEDKDKKDEVNQGKDAKEEAKQVVDKVDAPSEVKKEEGPKVFALHRDFYNMRLQRLRQQQAAKRTRDLLKTPRAFPAVPKGPIG